MATIDRYAIQIDTSQANAAVSGLRGALGALAAAFGTKEILRFADGVTNLRNRLLTLTPNLSDVDKQFKAVVAIANASRSPLDAVGQLYFTIARAGKELGISQREAAQITDSLSKALTSSGMSAEEAAGPLLQLGQALQSGRFQGDELRSILEGMPVVARALADEMGVTIGELRRLGSEGKITGDVFVRAMRSSKDAIDEAFGRTTPTIGQSFQLISTSVSNFFDEFERNTGAFAAFAQNVKSIAQTLTELSQSYKENAEGIKTLMNIVIALGAAWLVFARIIPAVAAAQNAIILTTAAAGGAVGGLTTMVMGVIAGFKNFGLNILRAIGVMKSTLPVVGSLTAAIGALLKGLLRFAGVAGLVIALGEALNWVVKKLTDFDVIDWVVEKFKDLGEWMGVIETKQQELSDSAQPAIDALDDTASASAAAAAQAAELARKIEDVAIGLRSSARGYYDNVRAQEESLRIANQQIGLGQLQRNLIDSLRDSEMSYLMESRRINDELAKARRSRLSEEQAQVPLLEEQLRNLNERYKENLQTIKALALEQETLTRARELELYSISQSQRLTDELIKSQREMAKSSMSEIQRKYFDIAAAADDAARAAIRAEQARRMEPLSSAEIEEYYARAREGVEQLQLEQQKLFESTRTFEAGWKRAFQSYADEATNAAKQAERIFQKTTDGMEDMIVNFAKTGKFEFKSFVNSILETLLRSQVQQLIAQLFNIGGGGGGGSRSTIGRLLGFANGGIIPTNSPVLVGERGPEIISGAAGRVVTPNNQLGGTNVVYNINAVDAASFKQLVARDPGFIYAVTQQGAKSIPQTRR
jgi:tape measure domain-containing protein